LSNAKYADSPVEIERACAQILAAREIRQNASALRELGVQARYHQADVTQAAAMARVFADVYGRHGRLDGIVHGVGVLADKLIERKSQEVFDRVYDTKVQGALNLLAHVRDDTRFLALLSSVAAVSGNRGQTDYAAANGYLDALARSLAGSRPAARFLSVNWGPWRGAGMVTPALEALYLERGITLIPAAHGATEFVDELVSGNTPQVMLLAAQSSLSDFLPRSSHEAAPPASEFVAPRTPSERQVIAIWSRLLAFEPIGAHDNFFELGGYSALVPRFLEQVQIACGVMLEARDLFEHPTVAEIAQCIARTEASAHAQRLPVSAIADDRFPFLRR
jgi:NAD(P)-dependent dehydrogenase (short-subunit alcohol dehydrogenase family)